MTTQINEPKQRQRIQKSIVLLIVICTTIIVVHGFYQFVVHPGAAAAMKIGGSQAARDFMVIMKDMEQEVCLIVMIICSYLMFTKMRFLSGNSNTFNADEKFWAGFKTEGQIDWQLLLNKLEASGLSDKPLLQSWGNCIRRFEHSKSAQDASDALQASIEALAIRLEAENAFIRYMIWAIPSIGFIGTVRGIGQALAEADAALAGDISGMTDSLGVAFNSTLVALFISIFLMLLLHMLQRMQDGLVVQIQEHCEKHLLKHMH